MTQTTADPRAAVLDHIKELPPLPVVVHELLALMSDAECPGDEVNRILSSDQALASKVLRLVNSSFYGLPGRVSTIPRAVVILGHAAVRNLATGLAVAGALGGRLPPGRRSAFWRHALATASGAEVIGRRAALPDPQEAFVAALLHDIGLSVLLSVEPERCLAMLAKASDPAIGFSVQVEREVGLPPHARIGGEVCRTWGLPADVVTLVGSHGLVHPLDLPARLRACGAALELGHQLAERTAPPEGVRRHPERDDAPLLATFLRVSPARIEAIRASIEAAGPRIAEIARGA